MEQWLDTVAIATAGVRQGGSSIWGYHNRTMVGIFLNQKLWAPICELALTGVIAMGASTKVCAMGSVWYPGLESASLYTLTSA